MLFGRFHFKDARENAKMGPDTSKKGPDTFSIFFMIYHRKYCIWPHFFFHSGKPLLTGTRHIVNDQVNLTIQHVKKGYKLID